MFCKVLYNRLVLCLDKEGVLYESHAGWISVNRSYMDNVFSSNKICQGRLREGNLISLDVRKSYDAVWCDDLWVKL